MTLLSRWASANPLIRRVRRHANLSALFRAREPQTQLHTAQRMPLILGKPIEADASEHAVALDHAQIAFSGKPNPDNQAHSSIAEAASASSVLPTGNVPPQRGTVQLLATPSHPAETSSANSIHGHVVAQPTERSHIDDKERPLQPLDGWDGPRKVSVQPNQVQAHAVVAEVMQSGPAQGSATSSESHSGLSTSDEDANWRRLQTIRRLHEERRVGVRSVEDTSRQFRGGESSEVRPNSIPATSAIPATTSLPDVLSLATSAADPITQPLHLQSSWPVHHSSPKSNLEQQTTDAPVQTAASEVESAGIHAILPTIDELPTKQSFNEQLRTLQPSQPTESTIDVVAPRRPRPSRGPLPSAEESETLSGEIASPQTLQVIQPQSSTPPQSHRFLEGEIGSTMIPTDIGPLPADLWPLVGMVPPEPTRASTAQRELNLEESVYPPRPAISTNESQSNSLANLPSSQLTDSVAGTVQSTRTIPVPLATTPLTVLQREPASDDVNDVAKITQAAGDFSPDHFQDDLGDSTASPSMPRYHTEPLPLAESGGVQNGAGDTTEPRLEFQDSYHSVQSTPSLGSESLAELSRGIQPLASDNATVVQPSPSEEIEEAEMVYGQILRDEPLTQQASHWKLSVPPATNVHGQPAAEKQPIQSTTSETSIRPAATSESIAISPSVVQMQRTDPEPTSATALSSRQSEDAASHEGNPQPQIDTDELARKVYIQLKRTLMVEWERSGLGKM